MFEGGLLLVTDRFAIVSGDLAGFIMECLQAGLGAVQIREKDLEGRRLYELATEIRRLTNEYGARLIVNDRIDVAAAVKADGVHLGIKSFPPDEARRLVGERMIVGSSVHGRVEAEKAESMGADYLIFGPVFKPVSKKGDMKPAGAGALKQIVEHTALPVYAIGGMTPERVPEVMETGAAGVAVIGSILGGQHPGRETEKFLRRLK